MMVVLYANSMKLLHPPLLHSPVGLILLRYLASSYGYHVVQSIQNRSPGYKKFKPLFICYNRTDSLKDAVFILKAVHRRGHRECIPPTRPKEVVTWHLIPLKNIAKIFLSCTLLYR